MKKDILIATGCDSNFYSLMLETLDSFTDLHLEDHANIAILDLGLLPEQQDSMRARGYDVKRAVWDNPVNGARYKPYELGFIARSELREYFPGYSVYLWFDADAWAQTPEFFHAMVDGARANGAAVVREKGQGFKRDFLYNRWWYGHMIASFGLVAGLQTAYKPAVNIGILALSDTAPHWKPWQETYRRMIEQRGRLNMDQHAFNAALELDRLPNTLLPARCNWVATLNTPAWDPERKMVCQPDGRATLSVIHLAGPDKQRVYYMKRLMGGGVEVSSLTYAAIKVHKAI